MHMRAHVCYYMYPSLGRIRYKKLEKVKKK